MAVVIDLDSLNFDEMDELETISGCSFDEIGEAGRPKAKVMKALVFITLKRQNPDITLDEVGKMSLTDIDFEGDGLGTDVNPT